MRVRLPFLALLFACLFALLPSCAAAQNEDQMVDEIQAKFHFKDPATGQDLDHDRLKTVLKHVNGDSYEDTFLLQGAALVHMAKQKAKFDSNIYTGFADELIAYVSSDLGVPDWQHAGLSYAEAHTGVPFPYIADVFGLWQLYSQSQGGLGDLGGLFQIYANILLNEAIIAYISDGDPDPDNDAEAINDLVTGGYIPSQYHDDFIAAIRNTQTTRRSLNANLAADTQKFKDAVNLLIMGVARIHITPIGLFAPKTVTLDGSDSVGPYGTTAIGHRWTVDGEYLGVGATKTIDYWTVGIHHVLLVVKAVDAQNNLYDVSTETDFAVGAPPILLDGKDDNALSVSLHTIKNPKIASYAWDYGDGTIESGPALDKTTHIYASGANQQFTVRLKIHMVQDGHADVQSQDLQITFHQGATDWNAGTFYSDTDWGKSQSPYRIHGTLTIPKGVTLTLEPGVVLQFDQNAGLEVYGKLLSKGQTTSTKRVYFVPAGDNSPPSLTNPGQDRTTRTRTGKAFSPTRARRSPCRRSPSARRTPRSGRTRVGCR